MAGHIGTSSRKAFVDAQKNEQSGYSVPLPCSGTDRQTYPDLEPQQISARSYSCDARGPYTPRAPCQVSFARRKVTHRSDLGLQTPHILQLDSPEIEPYNIGLRHLMQLLEVPAKTEMADSRRVEVSDSRSPSLPDCPLCPKEVPIAGGFLRPFADPLRWRPCDQIGAAPVPSHPWNRAQRPSKEKRWR